MITYKNEINSFWDLKDLCWSGAIDRLNEIEELGLEDKFMEWLEDMLSYNDDLTLTTINDFIWFECDGWIEQHKENEEDEEKEE